MKAPLGELFAELSAVKIESAKAKENATATLPSPKPEPVPEKSTPKAKMKRKLPGLGVSIRGKSNKLVEEQGVEETEQVLLPQADQLQPLNRAEVEAKWRTFARAQENFTEQTLLSAMPQVDGDNTITVALQNNFQKHTIEEVQQTLMPYLRKQLNNRDIILNLVVSADLESTRAFTPHERLKEMIKEQPELKLLIERFNLEIE